MKHVIRFSLEFTPDGSSTIVHGTMEPDGQEIEFCVPTGTDEEMAESARMALLKAFQDAAPGCEVKVTDKGELVRD